MKKHINTFNKGLNRDYSKNKFPNDCYYNAEGLRLITNDGLSSFALTNIEGNTLSASLDSGWTIHGQQAWCVIRNSLIILAIGSTPGTNDRIYKFTIGSTGSLSGGTVLYTGDLGFNASYKIKKLIGVFESTTIQKIYWTDGYNRIKFCNIADSNLSSYTAAKFDIIPVFSQSNISINSLSTGNLKSGMVQYSYQLYNLYGAETNFIFPCSLTALTSSGFVGADINFTGDKEENNSGKAVNFTINTIDTNFNRIRVVRILYTSLLADPEITIIEDTSVESSMNFVDIGTENLGNYTLEEFNFLKYDFTCQDLETKNNLLFASNIQEFIWDVDYDARTYRFTWDINPRSIITDVDYSNAITVDRINFNNVPETHDCFNSYNDFRRDGLEPAQNCRASGNQLGGSGKNIEYYFSLSSKNLDNSLNSTIVETNFTGNTNPTEYATLRGFQRDEIYSFAIVLINNKGQRSYPKWIGDVRFPKMDDYYTYNLTNNTGDKANILGITFIVKNLPNDCAAFQIVRCERKSEDRTILAQGLIGMTREYNGGAGTFYCAFPLISSVKEYTSAVQPRELNASKTLLEFISPEILYNKNLTYSGGDILEVCGIANLNGRFWTGVQTEGVALVNNKDFNFGYNESYIIDKIGSITTDPTKKIRRNTISDFKIVNYNTDSPTSESSMNTSLTIGSKVYENYMRKYTNVLSQGRHGTVGIIAINSNISITSSEVPDSGTYGKKIMLANYRRAVQPYGGASYQARAGRTYIPCGSIYPTPNIGPGNAWLTDIYDGDVFISKFEYQRIMVAGLANENAIEESIVESIIFPVETSINTRWQTNKTFSQLFTNAASTIINKNAITIQENAGVHNKDNGRVEAYFTQDTSLYSYNSVYSKQNNTIKFYSKPLDLLVNPKYDNRVTYSNRKFNNETTDSFTKFKPLNFKDVDSQYGSINALVNYNTDLMFFQDTGWGVLSVEERELLPGSNGTQLTTGTGGILSRFDYVSTNGGCKYPNSIFKGRYSMYFYDSMNYSLFSFVRNGGDNNLSKLLGVQSFLNKNVIGNTIADVVTGYNPKYNEVMFTFSANTWSDGDYKTIIFNEKDKQFVRIDKVNPSIYINLSEHLHETTNNLNLYQRNIGNFGQFFGSYYPSKIVMLINPDGVLVNRFDFVQWITEFNNSNHKTFDTIRFYNDYQDSGVISLVADDNLFYLFRTWRFNQFFDADENRIKDSYMMLELTFNNAANDKLVAHDIITTYSPTAPF